jgi:hypothetical protein
MGMYNLVFEKHGGEDVLALLGLTAPGVGRFRDAWVERTETGRFRIAVYTRNGGDNRTHWEHTYDLNTEGPGCPCPGCIITYRLPHHPCYLSDRDGDLDNTYATVYFRLPTPAEWAEMGLPAGVDIGQLAAQIARPVVDMDREWKERLAALQSGAPLPPGLKHLGERITLAMDDPEGGSVMVGEP